MVYFSKLFYPLFIAFGNQYKYNIVILYMVKDIVDGYLGIMDLDLTNIPENLKKIMVEQHMKDIENYKVEQYQLKPHLRYENTVIRIQKMHHYSSMQQKTREE